MVYWGGCEGFSHASSSSSSRVVSGVFEHSVLHVQIYGPDNPTGYPRLVYDIVHWLMRGV